MNDGFLIGNDATLPDDSTGPGTQNPGAQCLGETHQAERIGLDIFVMLDVSGSMLDTLPVVSLLAPPLTKWDAVRQSIETFVQAPDTADIGIGLQYFPQLNDVPQTCGTNDECGAYGPCSNSICVVSDQIDPGGGAPPFTFVRAGQTLDACSSNRDCTAAGERCQTMIGACIDPTGDLVGADSARFLDIDSEPATVAFALCSQAADCQGLPGSRCEELGICPGDLSPCTPSIPCLPGLGTCTAIPYGCIGETICEEASYSAPAVEIDSSPTRSAALIASLDAQVPIGQTPTGPALAGALEQARLWAEDHPDRQVVTVLATDGFPTVCEPLEIADIASVASDAADAARPVRTFVIGVFGSGDLGQDGQQRLDTIARAGGTDRAIVVNTAGKVSQDFLDALNEIRNTAVSCDFQLDGAATLDFDRVNLQVTDAAGASNDLLNVGDASACGDDDGWYYVRDSAGTPFQLSVCPNTCGTFAEEGVRADLQIGCATRIR